MGGALPHATEQPHTLHAACPPACGHPSRLLAASLLSSRGRASILTAEPTPSRTARQPAPCKAAAPSRATLPGRRTARPSTHRRSRRRRRGKASRARPSPAARATRRAPSPRCARARAYACCSCVRVPRAPSQAASGREASRLPLSSPRAVTDRQVVSGVIEALSPAIEALTKTKPVTKAAVKPAPAAAAGRPTRATGLRQVSKADVN